MIFSIISLAFYLLLLVINFSDMTVNGSFTLGAIVNGIMLLKGVHPLMSILCGAFCSAIAGICTAFLYLKIKIDDLLAGIISMTALYSINMRILGKPNISLLGAKTIFSSYSPLFVTFIILVIIVTLLLLFLFSEIGLAIRFSGQNYKMGEVYGISKSFTVIFILALSNGLIGIAGGVFSQLYGFVDINMGTSIMIIGITTIVIGEVLAGRKMYRPFIMVMSAIFGSLLYQIAITSSLEFSFIGLKTSDVPFISSILVILMFWIRKKKVIRI